MSSRMFMRAFGLWAADHGNNGGSRTRQGWAWNASLPSVAGRPHRGGRRLSCRKSGARPGFLPARNRARLCPIFAHNAAEPGQGERQDEFDERRGSGDRPRSRTRPPPPKPSPASGGRKGCGATVRLSGGSRLAPIWRAPRHIAGRSRAARACPPRGARRSGRVGNRPLRADLRCA